MPNPKKPARLAIRHREGRDPVWVIRDGPHERSTECSADDLAGAHRALQHYLAETFRPDTSKRDLAAVSIAEVLTLHGHASRGKASAATIGYHIAALLPFWGSRTLADVKGSTCRAYAESRPVKASTARQELKTMQAAINTWHRESPLAAVPQVTLPPPAAPKERFLERREAAAMLWACRRLSRQKIPMGNRASMVRSYAHIAKFILLGIHTGTRHGAILDLRWEAGLAGGHVDLERGILYRKGRAERETSKRRPPFRLPPMLLAFLRRWKAAAGEARHVIAYGGAGVTRLQKSWAKVCHEAGLGPDVTPHTMRHTFITWELWKGRTIWDVSGDAGADATTIERVYGHHRPIRTGKVA